MTALTELRAKVANGTAKPFSIFNKYDTTWEPLYPNARDASNAYFGSLDAAKSLHEAVLPGWFVTITRLCKEWDGSTERFEPDDWRVELSDGVRGRWDDDADVETGFHSADNADPARAWLLAILDALIAKEDRADG